VTRRLALTIPFAAKGLAKPVLVFLGAPVRRLISKQQRADIPVSKKKKRHDKEKCQTALYSSVHCGVTSGSNSAARSSPNSSILSMTERYSQP
jgi:hypothetical protein